MHRTEDRACDVRSSRYVAERIRSARYVEHPGADHLASVDPDPFVEAVRALIDDVFGESVPDGAEADRVLATVLFTDVVGSTDLVAGSGIQFADRGDHELKGIPGAWRLYAVEAA